MKVAERDKEWFVADFETTGKNEYEKTGRTRVWLYAICDSNSNLVEYGDNIDKFMEWCANHHGAIIYFHNLKFDGTFIMSWLLEHEYPFEETLLSHSKRGFTALIGDMGEFYQIKINFAPNKQVVLYDSLKLMPLTVKSIAKSFGLPIEKEIIDYDKYEITDETLHYVKNDVCIVAMALKFFRDAGHYRMTIGSNAYHSFMDNYLPSQAMFPRFSTELLEEWRKAYRGGRSQVNPKYAKQILHNVKRYDINSMYPSIMAYKPLPYGKPIITTEPNKHEFEIYKVLISFKLKKGHLPTLLKTGSIFNAIGDTYWVESMLPIEIYISSIDMEIMKKHYDIFVLKYEMIWGFKTVKYLFKPWVDEYYEKKSSTTGGLRLVYKLTLNSLYGKFGSRPVGQNKIPYMDDEGTLCYKLSEEHEMGKYYLPMAIAITSWAHKMIDDAICETGMDNFVYCDTDSVHTLGSLPDELVDNHKLGLFKLEATEDISKYIRQKTYIYKENGKWALTCAGMPQSIKDYLIREHGDNVINIFDVGLHIDENSPNIKREDMKLRPIQVPGGTILIPVPFSLL